MKISVTVDKIQLRRGKASALARSNPLLEDGEPCFETDTRKLKVGDGIRHYNDLPYIQGAASGGGVTRLTVRRGSTENWELSNPILADGEPGLDTTMNRLKIGDGVTRWNNLKWVGGNEAAAAEEVKALCDAILGVTAAK